MDVEGSGNVNADTEKKHETHLDTGMLGTTQIVYSI
jgi:hypothetical protein